jgi:hypothetical protein
VAALQAAEVVEGQIGGLQLGAPGAVTDHHTLGKNVEEVGVEAKIVSTGHHTRVVGRRRLIPAAQALP